MKRIKTKPLLGIILAAALVGGTLMLLPDRNAEPQADTSAPKPALSVGTARPERASLPLTLAANGNIAAWQEATIGSESSGLRLAEVRVNVGDRVRAGELLARFADDSVAADVAQAQAALSEAVATEADAAANARRAQTLQSSGALSAQQISQYQTAAATAAARVEASRAALAAQQLRLRHTRLVAPDDGVISARDATVGAVVNAGTELFRMIRKGRLEWRAEVTANELGRIVPGTPVQISVANGATLGGRVRMIAPTVDVHTRIALVYVDLLTPDTAQAGGVQTPALAGMFARGEFELGRSAALTVPQQAVVLRDGFAYVFRVNPNRRVARLKIVTGRRLGERVEVLDGLAADTEIVAAGAGFLNDGDLVKVVAAARPAQGK